MSKITELLENNHMVINTQDVFSMEKVTWSLDSIPSPFIHRNMHPPTPPRPTKKIMFFPITTSLGLGLPRTYWPVSTTRLLHVWLEVGSHGFADECMKRLVRRALAEVNEPQLRVNGLVGFYDCSSLNTYHAEKLVHTMYLTKLQQTTVAYSRKSVCAAWNFWCAHTHSHFSSNARALESRHLWCDAVSMGR
jgi:hypothetical protein